MPQQSSRKSLHAETVRSLIEQLQIKDKEIRECEARKIVLSIWLTVVVPLVGLSILSLAVYAKFFN